MFHCSNSNNVSKTLHTHKKIRICIAVCLAHGSHFRANTSLNCILKRYNVKCTTPLPQAQRTGGDGSRYLLRLSTTNNEVS